MQFDLNISIFSGSKMSNIKTVLYIFLRVHFYPFIVEWGG